MSETEKEDLKDEVLETEEDLAVETEEAETEAQTLSENELLIKTLKEEYDKMQDYALRTKADLENIKKRNERLGTERYQDGKCDTLVAILPVLDSLDRAMAMEMPDSVKEGIEKIQKQCWTIFEKMGVTEIPAEGEEFDPNLHNAMMQVEDPENSGKVKQVFEKGYKYNDKILRHASVIVAK